MKCQTCNGTGTEPRDILGLVRYCPDCDGTGLSPALARDLRWLARGLIALAILMGTASILTWLAVFGVIDL